MTKMRRPWTATTSTSEYVCRKCKLKISAPQYLEEASADGFMSLRLNDSSGPAVRPVKEGNPRCLQGHRVSEIMSFRSGFVGGAFLRIMMALYTSGYILLDKIAALLRFKPSGYDLGLLLVMSVLAAPCGAFFVVRGIADSRQPKPIKELSAGNSGLGVGIACGGIA